MAADVLSHVQGKETRPRSTQTPGSLAGEDVGFIWLLNFEVFAGQESNGDYEKHTEGSRTWGCCGGFSNHG
ncbi:MAG TPA: hypothetical protein VGU25_10880 [Acidobacteriaceae bacterium]|nr:hypothetical protein [Acidobacteriaceae bacterium]